MSLLNIMCTVSTEQYYCSTEVYAAHFQKTQRHKLFSKTTLLQKASLKSLHSVLAKEGRSLVLTAVFSYCTTVESLVQACSHGV